MAKPIRTVSTTGIYGAPKDWDEEKHGPCAGLPVTRQGDYVMSYWTLTRKECFQLLAGQSIRLTIVGGQPPVMIEVKKPGG